MQTGFNSLKADLQKTGRRAEQAPGSAPAHSVAPAQSPDRYEKADSAKGPFNSVSPTDQVTPTKSQGERVDRLASNLGRVSERVPDQDPTQSAESWTRGFGKVNPKLGGNRHADQDLLLLDHSLYPNGKPLSKEEIQKGVDRHIAKDKKHLTPDQKKEYRKGAVDYLLERQKVAGLNTFTPDPDSSIPTPDGKKPADPAKAKARAEKDTENWYQKAQADLAKRYPGGKPPADDDHSELAQVYRQKMKEIDNARSTYVAYASHPEYWDQPGREGRDSEAQKARENYQKALKKNPGHLTSAYHVNKRYEKAVIHRITGEAVGSNGFGKAVNDAWKEVKARVGSLWD